MIRFFVGGIPKAMSVGKSARVAMGANAFKHFQVRANTEWCTLVGHIGRQHAPPSPLLGGVSLTIAFSIPRPATLPKRVTLPLKRPDIDNLIHKLTDQFNGVFWKDDSQIVRLLVVKQFAAEDGRPGVEITVDDVVTRQGALATLEAQRELIFSREGTR